MVAVLHVELVEQTGSALEFRFWRDNPNLLKTRTLAMQEIAQGTAAACGELRGDRLPDARLDDLVEVERGDGMGGAAVVVFDTWR